MKSVKTLCVFQHLVAGSVVRAGRRKKKLRGFERNRRSFLEVRICEAELATNVKKVMCFNGFAYYGAKCMGGNATFGCGCGCGCSQVGGPESYRLALVS